MDRIFDLPEGILQRILYFLSQEEVVRTSVLSKSWRYTWCTRTNLDFSDATFKGQKQEFLSVVDNALQQYCDQRVCLDEFHLRISLHDREHESVSLLEKWMPMLTTMGVKESRLSIRSEYGSIDHLPSVVFEAESLRHLSLKKIVLDENAIGKIALCKNLRSLHLLDVAVDDNIFQTMIAGFPLIETLCVDGLGIGLRTIKMNDLRNLKYFTFKEVLFSTDELCRIEIHPLSLETINVSYGNVWFHKEANFRNLDDLHLRGVRSSLDSLSFCKFPRLKSLALLYCDEPKESRIFIDAPNMLYFEYRGDFVPSVSFATNSVREWKSEIHVTYIITPTANDGGTSLWFLKLDELLKSLSRSKISLSIYHKPRSIFKVDIIQEKINTVHDYGRNKPVFVETLNLSFPLSYFSTLVNGAFSICRPRKIGNYLGEWEVEFVGYMWKILMERESGNENELTRLLFRDLEGANLEIKGNILAIFAGIISFDSTTSRTLEYEKVKIHKQEKRI
ncbi:hypothetical protein MIMGU_mgv1a022429mg [Erythranthe guttata]|uniref:F-box domain-containing protein n=1 Tax=Erythranthe guttata TaxID=4155 RepID=A0A022QSH4_ERYGU|nr:hypothetical protein MIMGU_mgv1a022429mg [Erythranthe guttata]